MLIHNRLGLTYVWRLKVGVKDSGGSKSYLLYIGSMYFETRSTWVTGLQNQYKRVRPHTITNVRNRYSPEKKDPKTIYYLKLRLGSLPLR